MFYTFGTRGRSVRSSGPRCPLVQIEPTQRHYAHKENGFKDQWYLLSVHGFRVHVLNVVHMNVMLHAWDVYSERNFIRDQDVFFVKVRAPREAFDNGE
jgi:hypothetical protein